MVDACEKPGAPGYDSIGAKGIKVYPRWREPRWGLQNFIDDIVSGIGPRPSLEHGLSRLDKTKDFEPGNMAWLTEAWRKALIRSRLWWLG